jgi:protein MPE1
MTVGWIVEMPNLVSKNDVTPEKRAPPASPPKVPVEVDVDAEADDVTKIMAKQSADWESTQEKMAYASPVYYHRPKKPVPKKPLLPGYVCPRCKIPGHRIRACPTLRGPSFRQDKRNTKAPTGIPKSFLKKIYEPSSDDESNRAMVTANGEYVLVQLHTKPWETYQATQTAGSSGYKKEWECEICGNWAKSTTRTPCCKKLYCFQCVEDALVTSDFVCPGCEDKEVLLDGLVPDEEVRSQITERWERKRAKVQLVKI